MWVVTACFANTLTVILRRIFSHFSFSAQDFEMTSSGLKSLQYAAAPVLVFASFAMMVIVYVFLFVSL